MIWTDVTRVTQPTAMQSASTVLNYVTPDMIRSSFDMTGSISHHFFLCTFNRVSCFPCNQSSKIIVSLWQCSLSPLLLACKLNTHYSLYLSYLETVSVTARAKD